MHASTRGVDVGHACPSIVEQIKLDDVVVVRVFLAVEYVSAKEVQRRLVLHPETQS